MTAVKVRDDRYGPAVRTGRRLERGARIPRAGRIRPVQSRVHREEVRQVIADLYYSRASVPDRRDQHLENKEPKK